ncbi:MAG: hypothetical protein ACREL3_04580 [Gemmatimonadales bacterium]
MTSLLEMLITFIAAMLILALIAQSVQEIVKVIFAVKGFTAQRALEDLVTESAQAQGLLRGDGTQVVESVVRRLANLGQDGVRPKSLRLDTLSAPLLGELIRSIAPAAVSSLKGLSPEQASSRLDDLATRAVSWFPLAMEPVGERYRRRMRGLALISAAIVVVTLNANALTILQQARQDPAFRERVQATALRLDSLDQRAPDSLRTAEAALLSSDQVLFGGGKRHPEQFRWWVGILASILLVSLGAPFWHDALEALFGMKNRIRAEAEKARSEVTAKQVSELK